LLIFLFDVVVVAAVSVADAACVVVVAVDAWPLVSIVVGSLWFCYSGQANLHFDYHLLRPSNEVVSGSTRDFVLCVWLCLMSICHLHLLVFHELLHLRIEQYSVPNHIIAVSKLTIS